MSQVKENRLQFIYQLSFSLSAVTFALAMLCTVPTLQEQGLFQLMLKTSAMALMLSEAAEAVSGELGNWGRVLNGVSMVGSAVYLWSLGEYEQFNRGEGYLVGQFCISLAYQLKIVCIIVRENKRLRDLFGQNKRRFMRYTCIALGTIFFLASSIILELQEDSNEWGAALMNLLAGGTFCTALVMLFSSEPRPEYETFEESVRTAHIVV